MSKRCFIIFKKSGTQEFRVASYGDNYIEKLVSKGNSVEFTTSEKVTLPIYNLNEDFDLDTIIFLEVAGPKETAYMFKPEEGAIILTKEKVGKTLDIDFSKMGQGESVQASLGNLLDVLVK